MTVGDTVRLTEDVAGLAAGSLGVLVGWWRAESVDVLVSFYDAGPTRVPELAIERAEGEPAAESSTPG